MNKITISIIRDFSLIILGTLLIALSYSLFLAPYSIIPGGVYGLGIIINHITQGLWIENGLPIGVVSLCFNIPIFLLIVRNMGSYITIKTVTTFFLIAIFTDVTSYYMQGNPLVREERLLSAFYGGAILGLGVYLIFLTSSSCAGTDTVAKILAKKTNMRVSRFIMIIDSIIVLLGLLAFKDWKVPLYSWLTIFIYGKVVDAMQPKKPHKAVFIIADNPDKIRNELITKMGVRGTFLYAKGMYYGKDNKVIFIIIKHKNLQNLKKIVLEIDENAFITSADASNDARQQLIV